MHTGVIENRWTGICLFVFIPVFLKTGLALNVYLSHRLVIYWPFLLEMLNLTSKTNSWIHKLPFDARVCLEGNKGEAFLVSLEYKAFLGTILVLASPIAKLTPFLHCNWSAKKDPNKHCPTKQGPATTNSTALAQCRTLSAEWVIACMLTMLKKKKKQTQNSALEPQTLKQSYPPFN